jgi:SAM-dependent methyltransferase
MTRRLARLTGSCPVCGEQLADLPIKLEAPDGRTVCLLRCSLCGLEVAESGFTADCRSSPTAESYRDVMHREYDANRERISQLATARLSEYGHRLAEAPHRILEIGSGPGWMVAEFRSLGIEAIGIDSFPESVVRAVPGADVRHRDIVSDDLADLGEFDVVFASQTLEHIYEPSLALLQMARRLRPGGLLHIDVPNGDSWGARLRRLRASKGSYGAISLPEHEFGYQPRTLSLALSLAGMQRIEVLEKPVNDRAFGQTILPKSIKSKLIYTATRFVGHGYLLVGFGYSPIDHKSSLVAQSGDKDR